MEKKQSNKAYMWFKLSKLSLTNTAEVWKGKKLSAKSYITRN